jgi:hypothetical protein
MAVLPPSRAYALKPARILGATAVFVKGTRLRW